MDKMELEQLAGKLFQGFEINGTALIQAVAKGDIAAACSMIGSAVLESIGHPFLYVKEYVIAFFALGIGAALLKQLSTLCKHTQVKQLGFWIVYLILAKQLITLYYNGEMVARTCLERLLSFGNVFVPVFSAVLTISSGSITGSGYIAVLLFIIYLIERFLLVILLPMTEGYMLMALLGVLWQKERVEKMMECLAKGISLGFKGIILASGGMSLLQSMLLPYIDQMKHGTIKKVLEKIPVAGGVTKTTMELAAGSAVLLKNGIGVIGVLLLCLAAALPLFKIGMLCVLLKVVSAMYGLLGEKQMTWCADKLCTAQGYVWKIVLTATTLFFVWIMLAVYTTNQRFAV